MKVKLFLKLAHLLNCQKISKRPLYLSNNKKISRDLTYFWQRKPAILSTGEGLVILNLIVFQFLPFGSSASFLLWWNAATRI